MIESFEEIAERVSRGEVFKKVLDQESAFRPCRWRDKLDKIIFSNRQWAVTEYGLENIAGPYHYFIPRDDLYQQMGTPERTWVDHMIEKNWVDDESFREAFVKAKEIHAKVPKQIDLETAIEDAKVPKQIDLETAIEDAKDHGR